MAPVVPPLNDYRLSEFLAWVRKAILVREGVGPDGIPGTVDDPSGSPFALTMVGPHVVAGTGQIVSTENTWETISDSRLEGLSYAYIQFYMFSSSDDAGGTLKYRTADGAPIVTAAIVRPDGTSDADRASIAAYLIPLQNGTFQYRADITDGSAPWEINLIGYIAGS